MAAVVWRLARASKALPSSTRVITTAADSKYSSGALWAAWGSVLWLWRHHNHIDKPQAAEVPSATNWSMLPLPALRAAQPAL